jgi:DNA-directed RNA polymerase subunit omega
MARYTSEAAALAIGNRFNLVLAASARSRELKAGHAPRVSGKSSSNNVTALREIEEGKYTLEEWMSKLPRKRKGHRDEYYPT